MNASDNASVWDEDESDDSGDSEIAVPAPSVAGSDTSTCAPWTREEDALLAALVEEYGARRWGEVATHMRGRSAKQCREHWHAHHAPSTQSQTPWTPAEDSFITRFYREHGPQWAAMASLLPRRSDAAIKHRWDAISRRLFPDEASTKDELAMSIDMREEAAPAPATAPATASVLGSSLPPMIVVDSLPAPSFSPGVAGAVTLRPHSARAHPHSRASSPKRAGSGSRTNSPALGPAIHVVAMAAGTCIALSGPSSPSDASLQVSSAAAVASRASMLARAKSESPVPRTPTPDYAHCCGNTSIHSPGSARRRTSFLPRPPSLDPPLADPVAWDGGRIDYDSCQEEMELPTSATGAAPALLTVPGSQPMLGLAEEQAMGFDGGATLRAEDFSLATATGTPLTRLVPSPSRSRRASTQSMLSPPQLGCELPSPHALAPSPLMPDSEFSFDIPTRMQGLELGSTPSSGPASMPRGLQRRLLGGVNAQLENDCFAP